MMRRRLTLSLPVVLLTVIGPAAVAAWTSAGDGAGSVTATSVNEGNPPVATPVVTSDTEGSVGLSWSASTLGSGDQVTHYDVLRSDGVTACAGATTTSCSDTSPVPGRVSYSVVPRIGAHWVGSASAGTGFQFDVYAPVTTVERTPVANESGWDNDAVHITLTAADPGPVAAGVSAIHYTINGGPEVTVPGSTAEFDVTEEDQYAIAFWAVDNLGNTEGPGGTEDVNIDKTAPVSSATLSGDQATLSATDSGGSGLAYIEYRVGPGTYSNYGAPVTLSDGETIYFRAVDIAGNVETPEKSVTYTAPVTDSQAPSTSLASSPTPNAAGWTTANTTLTLTSTDNVAVTKLEWRLGSSGTVTTITGAGPFTVGPFTAEGTTTVQYRALDAAGNAEAWTSYDVKTDKTASSIMAVDPTQGGSYHTNNSSPGSWARVCTTGKVCATVQDLGGSGVASVTYTLEKISSSQCWNGSAFVGGSSCSLSMGSSGANFPNRYEGVDIPRQTMGAGSWRLTYRATDAAGHIQTLTLTFSTT